MPDVLLGKKRCALAISEPYAGSDVAQAAPTPPFAPRTWSSRRVHPHAASSAAPCSADGALCRGMDGPAPSRSASRAPVAAPAGGGCSIPGCSIDHEARAETSRRAHLHTVHAVSSAPSSSHAVHLRVSPPWHAAGRGGSAGASASQRLAGLARNVRPPAVPFRAKPFRANAAPPGGEGPGRHARAMGAPRGAAPRLRKKPP